MKIKEVRELDNNVLVEKIESTEAQLHQLKLNHAVSPLANPSQIKATRRDIARMKTELSQRELNK